jgi:hypothetical protein
MKFKLFLIQIKNKNKNILIKIKITIPYDRISFKTPNLIFVMMKQIMITSFVIKSHNMTFIMDE